MNGCKETAWAVTVPIPQRESCLHPARIAASRGFGNSLFPPKNGFRSREHPKPDQRRLRAAARCTVADFFVCRQPDSALTASRSQTERFTRKTKRGCTYTSVLTRQHTVNQQVAHCNPAKCRIFVPLLAESRQCRPVKIKKDASNPVGQMRPLRCLVIEEEGIYAFLKTS